MTRTLDKARGILSPKSISGGVLGGFRNKIINGNFDVWQRGTSFSVAGYGADRFVGLGYGHTITTTREEFTLGQTDVPGNPRYFWRTALSGGSGTSAEGGLYQPIEFVHTLAGKEVTLTFYGKASSALNFSVEFGQVFGTGGSPSTSLLGGDITVTSLAFTTDWQRYDVKITLPSIASKTLGSNDDSRLFIILWFSGGSDKDTRNNSLGFQSGTFDIARMSLVEGDATLEDDPFEPRHINQERDLCHRYYRKIGGHPTNYTTFSGLTNWNNTSAYFTMHFDTMRIAPTISHSGTLGSNTLFFSGGATRAQTAFSVAQVNEYSAEVQVDWTTSVGNECAWMRVAATNAIEIDAEI